MLFMTPMVLGAPAAFAQTIPPTIPPTTPPRVGVGLQTVQSPLVTIGDGVNSEGQFNGSDELPFLQAVAALPVGGSILVGQGTYTFSSPVAITAADVEIRGSGATLLSSNDVATGIFHVTGSGVRITGLRFRDDQPVAGHALLRVQAGSFRLRDCEFFGGDAVTQTPVFIDVALASIHDGELWIQDNAFHPDRGWTVVRVAQATNAHITGNRVGIPNLNARALYVFHCTDMRMGEITGNIVTAIGDGADPLQAVVFSENGQIEGHHLVIANNVFHDLSTLRVIHLRGSRFNVVANNSIGRILGQQLVASLDIENNSIGGTSASTTIQGNDFHNVGPAPAIRINDGVGYHISGNLFSVASSTSISVGAQQQAVDVSVHSNQFTVLGPQLQQPAIWLSAGDGHVVMGNSFRGFGSPAVVVLLVDLGDFEVSGNFEL